MAWAGLTLKKRMQKIFSPVPVADWRASFVADREKTLTQLYARVYPMVRHYVQQRDGSPEDAQDVLQEAIIVFYEQVLQEQLVLTASATTYLMGICKNLWRRERDRRNRQPAGPPAEANPALAEIETEPTAVALNLVDFVAQLGAKCQAILVAFYYFGQPLTRIAEQHTYRTVRSATVQKFKCLERLRKSLAGFTPEHFR